MGLNIVVYNLRWPARIRDNRFDDARYLDDYTFVAWLNSGNAIYRHFGDPHRLDSFLHQMDGSALRNWVREHEGADEEKQKAIAMLDALESDEIRTRLLIGEAITTKMRELDSAAEIFERLKNILAARTWVYEHVEWDEAKKRLLGLLDLLESDDDLWVYESW